MPWRDEQVTVTLPRYWWLLISTVVRLVLRTHALDSEREALLAIDREVSDQSGYGEAAA